MRKVNVYLIICCRFLNILSPEGDDLCRMINMLIPLISILSMTTSPEPPTGLKILSWNIGMLPVVDIFVNSDERTKSIASVLDSGNYDIIVFQEAFTSRSRKILRKYLQDRYPYAYGPVNSSKLSFKVNSGLWILSKIPLELKKEIEFTDSEGLDCLARKGAALFEGIFGYIRFHLVATHLQDDDYPQHIREKQFAEIYELLLSPFSEAGTPQIICGDLNTDEKNTEYYRDMLCRLDAEDGAISGNVKITFDDRSGDRFQSSHGNPRLIDYVLTRNSEFIQWIDRKVAVLESRWGKGEEYLSDHHGIEAVIKFKTSDYLSTIYK